MEHLVGRGFTFAVRQLRRAPVFTISAVLTLALGLGLVAGLGSVLNALVSRTLPIDDPDRLVVVSRVNPQGKTRWMPLTTLSAQERDSRTFGSVCGYAEGMFPTSRWVRGWDNPLVSRPTFASLCRNFMYRPTARLPVPILVCLLLALAPPAAAGGAPLSPRKRSACAATICRPHCLA